MAKKAKGSKGWGGKREKAGVRTDEPVRRVTITLPESILKVIDREAYAKQGGSRSATIARLLKAALKGRKG